VLDIHGSQQRSGTMAAAAAPLTALIVVPSLEAGAADFGALTLARILAGAGHRPIVVSSGGRLAPDIMAAGADFIAMDTASQNPIVILRNAALVQGLPRAERAQAPLQQRDGARRPRDRRQRSDCRACQ
jgi:hypothetical protein